MIAGHHSAMYRIPTVFTSMRLRIDRLGFKESGSAENGTMQVSKMVVFDKDGNVIPWPLVSSYALVFGVPSTSWGRTWGTTSETAEKCLDGNVNTKMCLLTEYGEQTPVVQWNFGGSGIDLKDARTWQWWTANDTASVPHRNMIDFSLWFSSNGLRWECWSNVVGNPSVAANYSLGYEGPLHRVGTRWVDPV